MVRCRRAAIKTMLKRDDSCGPLPGTVAVDVSSAASGHCQMSVQNQWRVHLIIMGQTSDCDLSERSTP